MPSTQIFRRRIKSVNNTKQITKAMEMIASIKMQKAVRTIGQARIYIQEAWNILHLLAHKVLPDNHPLISTRPFKRTAVILITSDRGLCGSYNTEIIKKFVQFEREKCASNTTDCNLTLGNCDVIAIGKVGAAYTRRYNIGKLIAEFKGFDNDFSIDDIIPISKMTNGEYLANNYDRVVVIYSHFSSSIKQVPVVQQILPITDEHIDMKDFWATRESTKDLDYKFEPTADQVFDSVLIQIARTQVYGAVLEANASEHSARMVAMKNATDNAKDLIDELQLIYNSVRQDGITREIAEISGAAEAMK
ncbi:MAG: ATP synthase F1 subunit gamma [bacterium]